MSFQLKDAATTVIVREKSTSLSEPVSIEFSIKFTKDTLKSWFKNTTKSNFLELNDIEKQLFVNENPIIPSRTICCNCGFLLDIESASGQEFFHYDLDDKFSHFGKLRDAIDEFKVERKFGKCNYIDKIIGFVDVNIMNFGKTGEVNSSIFSAICIDNAKGLIYKKTNIHHSRIMDEIVGYSHSFCKLKV